jgi:hypothetical protein
MPHQPAGSLAVAAKSSTSLWSSSCARDSAPQDRDMARVSRTLRSVGASTVDRFCSVCDSESRTRPLNRREVKTSLSLAGTDGVTDDCSGLCHAITDCESRGVRSVAWSTVCKSFDQYRQNPINERYGVDRDMHGSFAMRKTTWVLAPGLNPSPVLTFPMLTCLSRPANQTQQSRKRSAPCPRSVLPRLRRE